MKPTCWDTKNPSTLLTLINKISSKSNLLLSVCRYSFSAYDISNAEYHWNAYRTRGGWYEDFIDCSRHAWIRRCHRQRCQVRISFLSADMSDMLSRGSLHSFAEISGYLERQYDDILAEESRIKRNPRFRDNRVHVLLYFITPTGHA